MRQNKGANAGCRDFGGQVRDGLPLPRLVMINRNTISVFHKSFINSKPPLHVKYGESKPELGSATGHCWTLSYRTVYDSCLDMVSGNIQGRGVFIMPVLFRKSSFHG